MPNPRLPTHAIEDCLRQAVQGDGEALGKVFDSFRSVLLRRVRRLRPRELRPKYGSSDLVQQAFADAGRDIGHFRGTSLEELLAWLIRILHNNVRDVIRAS